MATIGKHYIKQGCETTHNCPYTITAAPLGGQLAGELKVSVKYEYLSTGQIPIPRSNPDISRWELQITGEFNHQDLSTKLNDEEVPLTIQNDVVSLVADHVTTSSVGLQAWIEVYVFDYEDKEVVIKGDEKEIKCVICLEEFKVGFEAVKLPCEHMFHGDCIVRWLENRTSCPLCRCDVLCV